MSLLFSEISRQEYSGNKCVFSAGFVSGDEKPECDNIYLKMEKEGEEPTLLLLRPDEAQTISWLLNGVIWSHLMSLKPIEEVGA